MRDRDREREGKTALLADLKHTDFWRGTENVSILLEDPFK